VRRTERLVLLGCSLRVGDLDLDASDASELLGCLELFLLVGVRKSSSSLDFLAVALVVGSGVMGLVMLVSISVLLMLDRLLLILGRLVLKLDMTKVFSVRSSLSSLRRGVLRIAFFIQSGSILNIKGRGVIGGRGVTDSGDIIGNGGRPSLDLLFFEVLGVVLGVVVDFFLDENIVEATDSKSWYCSSTPTESESPPPPPPPKKCNRESLIESFRPFTSGISARFTM
jgi:hypothetical protein